MFIIYPKIRIPIGEMSKRIYSKIGDKQLNINAAEIIVENIDYDSEDVYMGQPSFLLALTTEQFDDFIKYNTIPSANDTTAVIANYSHLTDSYKLENVIKNIDLEENKITFARRDTREKIVETLDVNVVDFVLPFK